MKRIISFILSVLLVVNTTTFIYANDDAPTVEESTYTLSIEEVEGGTVPFEEDEDNLYIPDTELYFNVEPDDGYILEDIYAVSKDNGDIKYELTLVEGKYLLVMPNDNVSIIPVFTKEVKEEIIEEEILPEETETVVENPPLDSAVLPEVDVEPQSEEPDYQTGYVQDNIPALSIYDSNYKSEFRSAGGATIPSKYSSVDKGYITPVKNQNPFGTCWSFAAIAAAEASLVASGKMKLNEADLSERHLAYFSTHEAIDRLGNLSGTYATSVNGNYGNDAGDDKYLFSGNNSFTTLQTMASWKGPVLENEVSGINGTNYNSLVSNYPYYPNTSDKEYMNDFYNRTAINNIYAFDNDKFHLINAYDIACKDRNDVKKAIMKYGAGAVSINYQNSYMDYATYGYYNGVINDSNHLVTIVGWDDNFDKNNFKSSNYLYYGGKLPQNNGAWLIKNSWGPYWMNKGYFWLSYEDLCLKQAWSKVWFYDFDSKDNYDNNYQYDGTGAWYYNYLGSGGSIANVFRATANPWYSETLEAVSFTLTNSVNVDYSIQIYKNLNNPNDPTSGTPLMSKPTKGNTKYPGYYTVALNEPVNLNYLDEFSVVITLSHKDGSIVNYDVDRTAEFDYANFYCEAQPYRSFEKDYANSPWEDLSGEANEEGDESHCTARIKAFTTNKKKTSIEKATVSNIKDKVYTGYEIKQSPTVKLGGKTLVNGRDYIVTYNHDNIDTGTATLNIVGRGDYAGSIKKTFKIYSTISLDKKAVTIGTKNVGKYKNTVQLKAKVISDKGITWTSSNTKIAKVDKNGKVTAVSDPNYKGSTVTITAKTTDGKTATCKVTVEDPINAFVRRLYKYCLNRNPDKTGFNYWTSRLRSKKITAAEAVKGFFDSKEMKDMKLSNAETIERCYLAMMDRRSDKGGKEYWIKNFKKYGKIYVLKGFVNSQEFTKICKDFNITKGSIKG